MKVDCLKLKFTIMKLFTSFLFFIFFSALAYSQTFEIRAVSKGGGVIGVELRATSGLVPTHNVNQIYDIVFGLRWLSSYNVDLSTVSGAYNITKSGTRATNGSYNFQAFFANFTPFNVPSTWTLNTWVEILSISTTLDGVVHFGTFEICPPGFDPTTNPDFSIDLTNPGKSIDSYTPTINGSATNVVVPLTLLDFTAKSQKDNINLLWQTASEINFTGFELQRSTNDAKNFVTLAEIKGKGAGDYDYMDVNVAAGDIYYYRLKMLDKDGTFTYSNIKSGSIEGKTTAKIYPNPTNNNAHLLINTVSESDAVIQVFNVEGQLMRNISSKLIFGSNDLLIDLSNLSTGIYSVLVNINNEQFSLKVNKE